MDKLYRFAIVSLLMWLPVLSRSQKVRSFYPLVTEDNAIVLSSLQGKWIFDSLSPDTLSIVKKGDNFYHLQVGKSALTYEAAIGKLDDILVLQLLPLPNKEEGTFKTDFIPVYTFYKTQPEKDTLRLADINYDSMLELIKKDSTIKYVWLGDALVLNLTSEKLRQFISSNKHKKNFFDEKMNFSLASSREETTKQPAPPKKMSSKKQENIVYSDCIPSFPLKDGWFGGDGDVSVAISPTKTLWLFSDSFVGGKEQKSRPGSVIIANSVGVMSCGLNDGSVMEYFWNDKFTSDPKPVFQTFTDRYRFWINDAFFYDSTLFVVLDKIGRRSEPAAVDETFNFEHLGWSLARVNNPYDSPDSWEITYSPITGIPDKQWNGQFVLDNGYVYMFFRKEKASILTRYPVESVALPLDKIEYYTTGKIWQHGAGGRDAAILFSGDDCQTVEYHPGLKKWIMIIGPGFWSNKIRMRQATQLTGPWSDEETIYECPEQTPGSLLYHQDNFCYLGREHIQFYDPKTRTMVLTYDHNTTNFQKLVADTSIYVPKVISVKLKK